MQRLRQREDVPVKSPDAVGETKGLILALRQLLITDHFQRILAPEECSKKSFEVLPIILAFSARIDLLMKFRRS